MSNILANKKVKYPICLYSRGDSALDNQICNGFIDFVRDPVLNLTHLVVMF